jgi:hypothetical protein
VQKWVTYIVILLSFGCGKPQLENKRGTALSSAPNSKPTQVDGELTNLPPPKYKSYQLCEDLKKMTSESQATKDAIAELCDRSMIAELRRAPAFYDGKNIPLIHEKVEDSGDSEVRLTWFETMLVNATAAQYIDLQRLRLTNPETYAAHFVTSSDIKIKHEATDGDKITVAWENDRIAYLPQAFRAEVKLNTLKEEQAYVFEWSLAESQQSTKSYSEFVVINQIGMNRCEVLTYTDLSSEHGGDSSIFKARTFDTRQELMKISRENAVLAYKAKDMLPSNPQAPQ